MSASSTRAAASGSKRFALVGIKLFADGALGSRGAALLSPYRDVIQAAQGLELTSQSSARTHGEIGVHTRLSKWRCNAIGDRGVRNVIDAYEAAGCTGACAFSRRASAKGIFARRFAALAKKVLHVDCLDAADACNVRHGVGRSATRRRANGRRVCVGRSCFLDAGLVLTFGSDAPVEDLNPLFGFYASITRRDAAGQPAQGWRADQKLDFSETVLAYTRAPAFAVFEETKRGAILPGRLADLTIFDRDLRAAAPAELRAAHVLYTIVDGIIEYDRDAK